MIALDLDGTLANYGNHRTTVVNVALIAQLAHDGVRQLSIATNQGGIPFAIAQADAGQPVTYPTADDFWDRVLDVERYLTTYRIRLMSVHICTFHPRATQRNIQLAARHLRERAPLVDWAWHIYTTPAMRKPAPGMLRRLAATGTYYGDSAEDRAAAFDAGWTFVAVARL